MSTEIYYFSGTGNSLFAARELQKRLPDAKLLPIASLLGKKIIQTEAVTVGFVFPVHALTIPFAVKEFLAKADLASAGYLFTVATRRGTVFHGFEVMDALLKKSKKQLAARFLLNMYGNESNREGYAVPSQDDIEEIEVSVLDKINAISEIVKNKQPSAEKDAGAFIPVDPKKDWLPEKKAQAGKTLAEMIGGKNFFYADDKCTGCGICKRVCLSGKIAVSGRKPEWQKKTLCHMCFACLNYCPRQSVQVKSISGVKSFSETNGRYLHPYADSREIAEQKLSDR